MDINEILIEEIRKHEWLYDLSSNEYKNVFKKAVIWEEIGKSVCLPGDSCKTRWRGLRDTYKRRKRTSQLSSGSGAPSPTKKWKYLQTLSFLDNYKDSRPTVGSDLHEDMELDFLLNCSSSTSLTENQSSPTTPTIDEGEHQRIEPLPRKTSKKQADAEVTQVFAEVMQECAVTVKELASAAISSDQERDATSLLFESLAKKISGADLPQGDVRRIEAKLIALVYDELANISNK
ncbi:PREDICTED: uncharacterized protein LOC108362460 [Rhagoletis zephyria]|uniref:uncharacterized protein LOC108362460 n=1 Tax=Rhagoletis zephyria TaxID=28612 RepID=UPI0008115A5F|nr:PREDICTED: uncharacterized protein LOC108362460 [Rhagoletis zephyria]